MSRGKCGHGCQSGAGTRLLPQNELSALRSREGPQVRLGDHSSDSGTVDEAPQRNPRGDQISMACNCRPSSPIRVARDAAFTWRGGEREGKLSRILENT